MMQQNAGLSLFEQDTSSVNFEGIIFVSHVQTHKNHVS